MTLGNPNSARRALVVDHDDDDRAFVRRALGFASITTDEAADAPEAFELMRRNVYDVVVLAVNLPSMSGITLLRELREIRDTAIVVHSACDDSMFAVVALESGADDYCVKPVTERELVLRVEMAIARHEGLQLPAAEPVVITAGQGLVVDPYSRIAAVDGVELDLTTKEFDLLAVLAGSPGQVFTRGELLELVWQTKPDWQSVDTVTEHVYRLRQKLDAGPERSWIQTVRGAGYRFAVAAPAPVEPGTGVLHVAG